MIPLPVLPNRFSRFGVSPLLATPQCVTIKTYHALALERRQALVRGT